MDIKVISLQDEAFYKLFRDLVEEVKKTYGEKALDKWVDTDEAMHLLRISSKTTLLMLRNTGKIRYSQPMTKVILYDRESIMAYIEKHAKDTF